MIKIYLKLWQTVCFLFFCGLAIAQCNINNFTLTPHNGTCNQDMSITLTAPELSGCTGGTTASIQLAGTTTVQEVAYIDASGSATFNNLEQGSYEIYLKNGTTTSSVKTINVTTSYNALQVSAVASNTTCATADPQYNNNGKVTVSYSGGTSNYQITLSGPGGPYTYTTTTAGSHTFSDLAPGNYIATVTDNSSTCSSSEARSATVSETTRIPLSIYTRRRVVNSSCERILELSIDNGNTAVTRQPGNAYYQIDGNTTTYPLIVSPESSIRTTFRTNALPANVNVTFFVTDGCRTITETMAARDIDDLFVYSHNISTDSNCQPLYSINFRLYEVVNTVGYWNVSPNSKVKVYKEVPADSNNWVLEDELSSNTFWLVRNNYTYTNIDFTTRYKYEIVDANNCNNYERIVDARLAPNANPLSLSKIEEVPSVLAGTVAFTITKNGARWGTGDQIGSPITISIARADGQTNMYINPNHPYSLGNSYSINFPYAVTIDADSWAYNQPVFTDLPPGDYIITITNVCGQTFVRNASLNTTAKYNPSLTVVQGCSNSNIIYNMNGADVLNESEVKLRSNNNGVLGTIIRDQTENPTYRLNGQFSTVPPGEYFVEFTRINNISTIYNTSVANSTNSTWSVARNLKGKNFSYYAPVTVAPYQQMDFSMVSLFCNPTDNTTGIVGVTATGIPIGFIRYSIWPSTANPNTDAPLQTYQTTNLNELTHVFTGLNAGSYIVRVQTECGFKDNPVTLTPTTPTFPQPVSDPGVVCQGSNTTLAIALPESLFDITWFDSNNNQIGSGSTISFPATQNATYTVKYQLNSTFNCANPYQGTDTVDVVIQGPIQEVSRTTVCSATDSSYTLTVEMSGATTYNVVGTGTPGTWNGNIWTSDPIPAGDQYNVTITDALGCNSVVVTGNSPNCFCYKPASTTGTPLETKHGITALARAGANDDNWPMVRNGAWTALESKTKGFVVNRIATTTAINNLPNPVEGMMVYDEEAGCIKIYTSTDSGNTFSWKCFNIQSCPD